MKYKIRHYTSPKNEFFNISQSKYDAIIKARLLLSEALYIEEKFDLLIENYLEYEQFTLKASSEYMLFPHQNNPWFHNKKNTFNRLLINFLATCRLFLDHVPHHFTNIFGKDTFFKKNIKPFISEQYDSYLGYRLFEEMRNYMQHRSYPITNISLQNKTHNSGDQRELSTTFTAHIIPKELDEDNFKKSVLNDLKIIGDKIDLKPFMRQYVTSLGRINNKIREELREELLKSDTLFKELMEKFNTKFKKNHGFLLATNDDSSNSKSILIIPELIRHRKYYENKNKDFEYLIIQYVTNKITK